MNIQSYVVQVIKTVYVKGNGTEEDPVRKVTAYFDLDGNLICERDDFLDSIKDNQISET